MKRRSKKLHWIKYYPSDWQAEPTLRTCCHVPRKKIHGGLIVFRRGGTGRRDGLKIRFPQGSMGSTPSAGRLLKVYGLLWRFFGVDHGVEDVLTQH